MLRSAPPMCKEVINASGCSPDYKMRLSRIFDHWMLRYHEMCAPECHVGRAAKCMNALRMLLGPGNVSHLDLLEFCTRYFFTILVNLRYLTWCISIDPYLLMLSTHEICKTPEWNTKNSNYLHHREPL